MPGQVSVNTPSSHFQPSVASLFPRVNVLLAVRRLAKTHSRPLESAMFFSFTNVDLLHLADANGVHTWQLFAVEHDPLTLSAG